MTLARTTRWAAAGAGVAVVAGAATLAAVLLPRRAPVHEIRLVVRDMAYYAEGESTPNPSLQVERGERVRVVLRNDDPGMIHDFGVSAWDARTPSLRTGDEATFEFTAPDQPGETTYACTPHGQTMRGRLTIADR